jgi:hypothetical protein
MLIKISNELLADDVFAADEEFIIRGIENILKSVWESKHLFHANLNVIEFLRQKVENRDCLNVLIFIDNNYSFLNYSAIKYYINVVPGRNTLSLSNINDCNAINVSIDYFQTTDILQESRILCEDITDAKFFEEIALYYMRTNFLGNISLSYEAEHGGGNQINVSFKKHVNKKNKLCLAFCDNDKRHPLDDIGNTLKNLRLVDTSDNAFCKCIELDAQEIENLVPFNYLDEIREHFHEQKGISFIKNIYESSEKESLKYYDVKNGITKKQVCNCHNFYAFMESLLPYCTNPVDLNNISTLNDKDKVIPHTGKIITSLMKKKEVFINTSPSLLAYQAEEWVKLGRYFIYWTCSRNKEALNI